MDLMTLSSTSYSGAAEWERERSLGYSVGLNHFNTTVLHRVFMLALEYPNVVGPN